MYFSKKIPKTLKPFVGYGVIIGGAQSSLQFSLLKKGSALEPLSWSFNSQEFLMNEHLYIQKLERVLYSMQSKNYSPYLCQGFIQEVLTYEKHRERIDRSEHEGPIFRSFVLYMLETTGVHVRDVHLAGFNADYSECLMVIEDAVTLAQPKISRIYEFGKVFFDRDFLYKKGFVTMRGFSSIIMSKPREKTITILKTWLEYVQAKGISKKNVAPLMDMLHNYYPALS